MKAAPSLKSPKAESDALNSDSGDAVSPACNDFAAGDGKGT